MKKWILFSLILMNLSQVGAAPAVTGDLRRVETKSMGPLELRTLLKDFNVIWGFDFLPEGDIIFTERTGGLYIYLPKAQKFEAIRGVPKVAARGQGGLLDVRVHPQFKENKMIVFSYSEPIGTLQTTAVATAKLQGTELKDVKRIFLGYEPSSGTKHFGSRIEFDGPDRIFLTMGDRDNRSRVQDLKYHNGKVMRIQLDGGLPPDNPFRDKPEARPEIWSYGHRNPQGLVRDEKTGELWLAEMGPRGGDELNLIEKGKNYGWPVITYGREYWGPKIGIGESQKGMEQPVRYWTPSISPSGLGLYTGTALKKWTGDLFLANLSSQQLLRLKIKDRQVIEDEALLKDLGWRFRQVRGGPDGLLYFSTDEGKLGRLQPLHSTQ